MLLKSDSLTILTLNIAVLFFTLLVGRSAYLNLINALKNIHIDVRSLIVGDYNVNTGINYSSGVVYNINQDLKLLNNQLQRESDAHNEDVYLVYSLISQFDVPVAVVDSSGLISYANSAFEFWTKKQLNQKQSKNIKKLGFSIKANSSWALPEALQNTNWQLNTSQFMEDNHPRTLIVINNIAAELRDKEREAWHQMVRVMSHEIKNSLTPIKSLTQTLLAKPDISQLNKEALQVIHDRSNSLTSFVKNYSYQTKAITVNLSLFNSQDLQRDISTLMNIPELNFKVENCEIYADKVLLEQVLINLIKNSLESLHTQSKLTNAEEWQPNICLSIWTDTTDGLLLIEVNDNGTGFQQVNDVFVPFYTTKQEGQGIGLYLCREIVEKHKGRISASNNLDGGAKIKIELPVKSV